MRTLRFAAWMSFVAVATSRFVTSGTCVVCGPFETVRLTVEPFAADEPAPGLWLDDGVRRLGRV